MRKKMHRKTNDERNYKEIARYSIFLLIMIVLLIIFLALYINNRTGEYINYTENAKVDYKVFLNKNEFYKDEYLTEDQQYISSLIKNIVANFKYNMNTSEEIDNNYKYRIDAVLNIKDENTKNTIYQYTENLLEEKNIKNNNGNITVNEDVKIDYKHFNNIATKFINAYKLSFDNSSVLNINLIVKTDKTEASALSLVIPLTKQTLAIDRNIQLASNNNEQIIISGSNEQLRKTAGLLLIIDIIIVLIIGYKFAKYISNTRTEEKRYKSEVRKILLNYGEYINKAHDYQFKLDEYEIVRVENFLDLIKIKEDLSRPIFMIENDEKTNTIFAITDNTKYIYMYALNMHQELLAEKNEYKQHIKV